MTTPRDLLIITMDVTSSRPVEQENCRWRSREPS